MTDKTPEEQAVIEAAEEWLLERFGSPEIVLNRENELHEALEALRASRVPKGVKPEDVEPNTRFRFAGTDRPYRCAILFPDNRMAFDEATGKLYEFDDGARLIPIQEEAGEECEHDWSDFLGKYPPYKQCVKCGVRR